MTVADTGRGRSIRQSMFGPRALRRASLPGSAFPAIAVDYFLATPAAAAAAVNQYWPLTITSLATNADPFDAAQVPLYVDISDRVLAFDAAGGRQYELDLVQAGEASMTIADRDEAFNPTNPQSPFWPNVKPYRQIADQAMWPLSGSAGATNLLNAAGLYDPTFDSYTAVPGWASGVATLVSSPA